ncbi:hypothetical protein AC481_00730 [miscellaneous Crenarchaeota group archaeon SMTZ-80]|nr:MAG: hypothetical protein AC481_00730 [miscellaneous Crenarchaeota group archaeon SMTZ-80]
MTKSPASAYQRIREGFKHSKIIHIILSRLATLGLEIRLFYVFREGCLGQEQKKFGPEFSEYDTEFLGPEDMKKIDRIEGRTASEEFLRERLEAGNMCLAVKEKDEIVGFTWCDFDVLDLPSKWKSKLGKNEAYLFDAFILRAYRGHGLAPFMRHRCYQELTKMGRDVFYSTSDYFNTPALHFKRKLGAQILKLYLYIQLFKRFRLYLKLKDYAKE